MTQFGTNLNAWMGSTTRKHLGDLSRARRNAADPVGACRAYWSVFIRGYFADTSTLAAVKSDICADPPASLANRVNAWTLGPLGAWDWRTLLAHTSVPIAVVHGSGDPILRDARADRHHRLPQRAIATQRPQAGLTMLAAESAQLDVEAVE